MTYQNKTIKEIYNDESYPLKNLLEQVTDRIRKLTYTIHVIEHDYYIEYQTKGMMFLKIVPEEEYIYLETESPYENILDLANRCDVKPYEGRNKTDIVSFKLDDVVNTQFAVTMANQAYIYYKRKIL